MMTVLVVLLKRKRVAVRQPGAAAGSRIGLFHDRERFSVPAHWKVFV